MKAAAQARAPAVPPGAPWPWPARIPAMVLAYGGAALAVLAAERVLHSVDSAGYAAIAVVPGGLFAALAAFVLSFTPRRPLTLLAASVIVALAPLAVIALSFDFGEFADLFARRALFVGGALAAAVAVATLVLVAGGVFGRPQMGTPI